MLPSSDAMISRRARRARGEALAQIHQYVSWCESIKAYNICELTGAFLLQGASYHRRSKRTSVGKVFNPFPYPTSGLAKLVATTSSCHQGHAQYRSPRCHQNDECSFAPLGRPQFCTENKFVLFIPQQNHIISTSRGDNDDKISRGSTWEEVRLESSLVTFYAGDVLPGALVDPQVRDSQKTLLGTQLNLVASSSVVHEKSSSRWRLGSSFKPDCCETRQWRLISDDESSPMSHQWSVTTMGVGTKSGECNGMGPRSTT